MNLRNSSYGIKVVHMYYLVMKTVVKPELKSIAYCKSKNCSRFIEKEINLIKNKFYQKLFVVLISLSTILIFSETPRELENICETYNSKNLCNVW